MLRVRDASAIGEAGTFQKNKASELEQAFNKLNTDINGLRESYGGAGAEANISAFLKGTDNFKNVINKIRSYGEYQEGIFNHDVENIDNANREINTLLADPVIAQQPEAEIATPFLPAGEFKVLDLSSIEGTGDMNV